MAFIDLGDQFINLSENRDQHRDEARHFGLVVDDKEKVRRRLEEAGVETLPGGAWNSGIRGATGFKSWSTPISNSPSTERCSKAWVARTYTNRLQRSRSSPRRASRLRKPSHSPTSGIRRNRARSDQVRRRGRCGRGGYRSHSSRSHCLTIPRRVRAGQPDHMAASFAKARQSVLRLTVSSSATWALV
jgi:hypothetical protein